jgi:hypothetical protein
MEDQTHQRDSALFLRLLFSYQAAAMQQMGKFADPLTGSIVRDLDQVRYTIDTLDMLRQKCKGNLSDTEERIFNQIISDLKLNFVDELNRPLPAESNPSPEPNSTINANVSESQSNL